MENVKNISLKSAVCGIIAGAVNGLLGAGGGIILVPLLMKWLKLDVKHTFATALSIMLPIASVSAASYLLLGTKVSFSDILPYLLGGAVGGFIGGKLIKKVSVKFLRLVFALILLFGGIRSVIL